MTWYLERHGVCVWHRCGRAWEDHNLWDDHAPMSRAQQRAAQQTRIRQAVFERDGWVCLYPGCPSTKITYDHVVPRTMGGLFTVDNGQTLCGSHNRKKSDHYGPQWDYRPTSPWKDAFWAARLDVDAGVPSHP